MKEQKTQRRNHWAEGKKYRLPNECMVKAITLVEYFLLTGSPISASVVNAVAAGLVNANDR